MTKSFEGKETEHNWAARERGVQRVRGMLKGDIHNRYPDVFLQCLKDGFMQASLKTVSSVHHNVFSYSSQRSLVACKSENNGLFEYLFLVCGAGSRSRYRHRSFLRAAIHESPSNGRIHEEDHRPAITTITLRHHPERLRPSTDPPSAFMEYTTG